MQGRIAVQDGLENIRSYLEENGYETTPLHSEGEEASIIIVNGLDPNPLGYATTTSKAPVIDAAGLSAEQVFDEVEKRLQLQH